MTIHNNTNFTPGDIARMKYLGTVQSEWHQKTTKLYADPEIRGNVVSVGVDFVASRTVICSEPRIAWGAILDEFKTRPVVLTQ